MKAYINFRKKNSRPIRHEFCKILMDIGKPKKKKRNFTRSWV